MVRRTITAASILALVTACGVMASPAPHSATAIRAKAKGTKAVAKSTAKADLFAKGDDEAKASSPFRQVGDYNVYQYTGSFAKEPLTLTEQVVGKDGSALLVDFVLEEGEKMNALRVRMRADGEVLAVRRITDDGDVPATFGDYEEMMRRTELLPDTNDKLLSTDHTTCLVGDEQLDCDLTTYRVTLNGKAAKLTITKSPRVPGRDIGGDIVAEDGKVLYSARMIERGNEPPVAESLARLDGPGITSE